MCSSIKHLQQLLCKDEETEAGEQNAVLKDVHMSRLGVATKQVQLQSKCIRHYVSAAWILECLINF